MNVMQPLLSIAVILSVAGCATGTYVRGKSTITGDGSNSDAAWVSFDSNRDGYLSTGELEQQHAVGLLRDLPVADANGDGKVSRDEWNAWWPLMTRSDVSSSMVLMNESAAPNGFQSR
jgi:hypothetical protein